MGRKTTKRVNINEMESLVPDFCGSIQNKTQASINPLQNVVLPLQNVVVTKTRETCSLEPEDYSQDYSQEHDEEYPQEYQEDKLVNELTLKYLMNKHIYQQYIEEHREEDELELKKDIRFYRKRIFHLVKMLLLSPRERDLYLKTNDCEFDISKIFDNVRDDFQQFLKIAIDNFKSIDTCDVIQEGNYMEEEAPRETKCTEYVDKIQKQYRMDNFLIIHKKENEIILPVQKEINLSDTKYKKKGLRRKE